MGYTAEEYTDMIICYGMAGENTSAAVRLYVERFPDRERHPSKATLMGCIQRARETGFLLAQQRNRIDVPVHRHVSVDEKVLRAFEKYPENSIRRIAHKLGISRSMVYRILKENELHPLTPDSGSE